ncbi:MAG: hypothetical protein Kow0042_10740 [Calditrichia bacterium]
MEIKKIDSKILLLLFFFILIDPIIINWLFKVQFFKPLVVATNFYIQSTLIAGTINLFIVSIVIFYFGRLDLSSVWFTREKVKQAALPLIGIWIGAHVIIIMITLFGGGRIILIDKFNLSLGRFLGQLFGNAPFEELVFRGVLFLQIYLLLKVKMKSRAALILALLISQFLFAFAHVPNRIWINQVDNLFLETLGLYGAGIGLTLIFIQTQNLAFLIGIHALANMPFIIVRAPSSLTYNITYVLIVFCALLWRKITPASNKLLLLFL